MRTAKRSRTGFLARRKLGRAATVKLLEEHPDGSAWKLLFELHKGFFVARVRDAPGGPLIDKLLVDETPIVDEALINRVLAVDLVMPSGEARRYSVDGGFILPIGKTRRFVATLRANMSDDAPINA